MEAAPGVGRIKGADGCCAPGEVKWVRDNGREGESVRKELDAVITSEEDG